MRCPVGWGTLPVVTMPPPAVRDDFAGPGGWDEGLRMLGITDGVIGVELDPWACATAEAAGHHRLRADVTRLNPIDWFGLEGYIASPPCPSWSRMGNGAGVAALDDLLGQAAGVLVGAPVHQVSSDPRVALMLEPLRVIVAARPRWVAFEQVPDCLPVWAHYAALLRTVGYSTATGMLDAADYGTPQHRRRAVLIAHLDRRVTLPAPTHGEDGGMLPLLPRVTVAEALGWTVAEAEARRVGNGPDAATYDCTWVTERPATTIAGRLVMCHPGANTNRFNTATKTRNDGLRLTLAEASVLQGFPADYPWQGNRGAAAQQLGNAVPPPLAAAVVGTLLGLDWPTLVDTAQGPVR